MLENRIIDKVNPLPISDGSSFQLFTTPLFTARLLFNLRRSRLFPSDVQSHTLSAPAKTACHGRLEFPTDRHRADKRRLVTRPFPLPSSDRLFGNVLRVSQKLCAVLSVCRLAVCSGMTMRAEPPGTGRPRCATRLPTGPAALCQRPLLTPRRPWAQHSRLSRHAEWRNLAANWQHGAN